MLTLVAGIDEVGYGPLLGPLVVSSSIFLIKKNPEIDMWDRLQKSVGKNKRGLGNRLLICDSKKAYNRKAGLGHLERTIKGFLNQLHLKDAFFSSVLSVISNDFVRVNDIFFNIVSRLSKKLEETDDLLLIEKILSNINQTLDIINKIKEIS